MLTLWAIYDRPREWPHHVVVQQCVVRKGGIRFTGHCTPFASLEDAREALFTRGLFCLPRQAGDDPDITELWLGEFQQKMGGS
jgi:hypothetical protein